MRNYDRFLCFKSTRNIHESGYRFIEYGYMTCVDGKETIEIVDRYDTVLDVFTNAIPFHLDLTKSGWFRVLPRIDIDIEWTYGGSIAIVGEL